MRMFLCVSGQGSELSIANHSSQPTVSQLKCVATLYETDLTITNHRRQKSSLSFTLLSFKTTSFARVFFQLLQFSRQRPSFSAHRAALMTKTHLIFPEFSSRFVDFAVQFCFRCKFSFPTRSDARVRFEGHDFPRPITTLCYA